MSEGFLMNVAASAGVAAAGTPATLRYARGCTIEAVHGVVGTYVLTLDKALDENDCQVFIQPKLADISAICTHTSDTVKTITCRTIIAAPAAADAGFDIVFVQTTGGAGR